MQRLLYVLALLIFALPVHADPLTLSTKYQATGTNPNGSKYSGTVDIRVISNSTFSVKWTIAGATYEGFGMRMNDALAATYTIDGEPGLVIYKVEGKDLDGLWAIRGHNGDGSEHLTPLN
jgi:hypothetical protein